MNCTSLHILRAFVGGAPNTDETGSPKSLSWGDANRHYWGGPPQKFALKDVLHKRQTIMEHCQMIRTKFLEKPILESLVKLGASLENAQVWANEFVRSIVDKNAKKERIKVTLEKTESEKTQSENVTPDGDCKKSKGKKKTSNAEVNPDTDSAKNDSESKKDVPSMYFAPSEIAIFAKKIFEKQSGCFDRKTIGMMLTDHFPEDGLELLIGGRMNANVPGLDCATSVFVSKAVSTHRVDNDVDNFICSDDLVDKSQNKGASHMGSKEHCSAVMYQTFILDNSSIIKNFKLAGLNNKEIRMMYREFIRAMMIAYPMGSRSNNWSKTTPRYSLGIHWTKETPISLADAFETPVQPGENGGFVANSVQALKKEFGRHQRQFGEEYGSEKIAELESREGAEDKSDMGSFLDAIVNISCPELE